MWQGFRDWGAISQKHIWRKIVKNKAEEAAGRKTHIRAGVGLSIGQHRVEDQGLRRLWGQGIWLPIAAKIKKHSLGCNKRQLSCMTQSQVVWGGQWGCWDGDQWRLCWSRQEAFRAPGRGDPTQEREKWSWWDWLSGLVNKADFPGLPGQESDRNGEVRVPPELLNCVEGWFLQPELELACPPLRTSGAQEGHHFIFINEIVSCRIFSSDLNMYPNMTEFSICWYT